MRRLQNSLRTRKSELENAWGPPLPAAGSYSGCHNQRDVHHTFAEMSSPASRIRAEQPDHLGELMQAVECARDVRIVELPDEIEIERVLERFAFDRPRFDLRQVDLEDCECAERAEKSAGLVRHAKDDRCFPAPCGFARCDPRGVAVRR